MSHHTKTSPTAKQKGVCESGCMCESSRKQLLIRLAVFMAGVATPDRPSCCAWCAGILAHELSLGSARVMALQLACPDFFSICMELIVLYADLNATHLRQRLLSNQQNCCDRHRHSESQLPCPGLSDPLDVLVWSLFSSVISGMTAGKRPIDSLERAYKAPFASRKGIWPLGLRDLFPLGVERGVKALVFWCCASSTSHPFQLLDCLLSVARLVMLPYLRCSPIRERLLWAMLQSLTPSQGNATFWPGTAPFRFPAGLTGPRYSRGSTECVERVLGLLRTLHVGPGNKTKDIVEFVVSYENPLLDALEPLVPQFIPADIPEGPHRQRNNLGRLIRLLRLLLKLPEPAYLEPLAPPSEPEHIMLGVYYLTCAHSCGNARCGANELSESGSVVRFPVCEFCAFAKYCSRACQRADWKDGSADGITHKMVCPLLRVLMEKMVADPSVSVEDGFAVPALEACDFDPRDREILRRWALASGVLPASTYTLETPPFSTPV